MHDLDGIETLHKLKKLDGYVIPPVVALTANAISGMREMYLNEADKVDEKLIDWLNNHPEVIRELRRRSGLD